MLTRRSLVAIVLLAAGTAASAQEPVRYEGHRVVRVTPTTARQLMTVRSLADDILTCEGSGIGTFDVRLSPERFQTFLDSGIRHTVVLQDLQAHLDQIARDDDAIRAGDDPAWFVTYRSLAEINTRIDSLVAAFPTLASVSTIGTSIQNRPIRMVRVTGSGSTTNRPAFVIQSNQHAREWITPHASMYILDRFLETYATDSRIRNIVDNIDFYIIPSVNPDGYEYSRTTNSQWRKNRRDNPGSCDGVDLNRNWGFQWGFDNTGSSGNTCSETYRGPAAWSEPEIAGIKTLVDSLAAQGRLKVHWDIHTNGQMFLSPWGYTTTPPTDLPLMNTLGAIVQAGLQSVRGTPYPYGQGSVILYLNNGNTRDYTYGVHGKMSWTLELSGNSFQPPVSEILPNCQEALAGLLPLAEYYIVPAAACFANCDSSTATPFLNVNDFTCFNNRFAAGNSLANCDASTAVPVLNVNDFTCFLNKFSAGCSAP
ncbi:MAG: M14 family zinc carboxypeptidase [Phycisphaerales bacterium]